MSEDYDTLSDPTWEPFPWTAAAKARGILKGDYESRAFVRLLWAVADGRWTPEDARELHAQLKERAALKALGGIDGR